MLKLLLYEAGTEIWPICNLIWQLPIYVFVGVPLTQNFSPLGMEWSKGVYYHPYFLTFTWTILVYSFTGNP